MVLIINLLGYSKTFEYYMNVLFLILPYIEVSIRSYFHYLILFFDSFLYIIYSDYPPHSILTSFPSLLVPFLLLW